jgi:hypothetical protein
MLMMTRVFVVTNLGKSASPVSVVSIYRVVRDCVNSAELVSGPEGVEE